MDRQGADALRAVLRANYSLGGEVVVFFGEFLQNVGEASRYRCLPTLNRCWVLSVGFCGVFAQALGLAQPCVQRTRLRRGATLAV